MLVYVNFCGFLFSKEVDFLSLSNSFSFLFLVFFVVVSFSQEMKKKHISRKKSEYAGNDNLFKKT